MALYFECPISKKRTPSDFFAHCDKSSSKVFNEFLTLRDETSVQKLRIEVRHELMVDHVAV